MKYKNDILFLMGDFTFAPSQLDRKGKLHNYDIETAKIYRIHVNMV